MLIEADPLLETTVVRPVERSPGCPVGRALERHFGATATADGGIWSGDVWLQRSESKPATEIMLAELVVDVDQEVTGLGAAAGDLVQEDWEAPQIVLLAEFLDPNTSGSVFVQYTSPVTGGTAYAPLGDVSIERVQP